MNSKINYEQISKEVKKVISAIKEMSEDEVLDNMSLLNDLGIDSLDMIDLVTALGKRFGVNISVNEWTEKIHSESLNIGQVGSEKTLLSVSKLTGLVFDENDFLVLRETLLGSYQTWDVVRSILGFIKVKSLIKYFETKMVGET